MIHLQQEMFGGSQSLNRLVIPLGPAHHHLGPAGQAEMPAVCEQFQVRPGGLPDVTQQFLDPGRVASDRSTDTPPPGRETG